MEKSKKIKEVQNQFSANSFEQVAFKLSESQTGPKGGDLGWVNEKALSKKVSLILQKWLLETYHLQL